MGPAAALAIGLALATLACGQTSSDPEASAISDAGMVDASPDVTPDAEPDADAKPPCIAKSANASATGSYPGGTFDAKYSIFWQASGECPTSLGIVFTEAPVILERESTTWPRPSLVIYVRDEPGFDDDVGFELYTDGDAFSGSGTAELLTESYVPTGNFSVETDTLSLSGTFAPTYCPELDIFCP